MKQLIAITILGLLLQGCASTLKLEPQAFDGQQKVFQEGVAAIISPKKALVAIRPSADTYSSEGRPKIVVIALNGTEEPFNFSTEDVRVFVDGEPHKVFTYDELVAEVKSQQAWAAFAVALSGAAQSMNAANAGYTYNSGTYNASAYDNYGNRAYGYGSYSGYTYNAAAAQQAQAAANAQTQANMLAIRNQTEQSLSAISATMLKKTTVLPQAWHGGYVIIEKIPNPEYPHDIRVVVRAAGEEHEFLFKHFKVKQSSMPNTSPVSNNQNLSQTSPPSAPLQAVPSVPIATNSEASEWTDKSLQSLQNKQWTEAIRTATVAISLDPSSTAPYINRGWAYAEKGFYDKAIDDCNTALNINPQLPNAINNRGLSYQRKGQRERAICDYRQACEMGFDIACNNFKDLVGYLPAEEISALIKSSEEAFSSGDYNNVISLSSKVISIQPNNAEAHSNKCGAEASLGLLKEGKASCQKAIELSPNLSMAYNNLGFVLEQEKNFAEASLYYEMSCSLGNERGCQNQKKLTAAK